MSTTVVVTDDSGATWQGVVEKVESYQGQPRWTVVREGGSKHFVYPNSGSVRVLDPGEAITHQASAGLSHLAPTPGASAPPPPPPLPEEAAVQAPSVAPSFGAPPVGMTRGGGSVDVQQPAVVTSAPVTSAPAVSMQLHPVQAVAPTQAAHPSHGTRFMVQTKTGRAKQFHTHKDCNRITDKSARTLDVDDEAIAFFDLSVCALCDKRDRQITFAEALAEQTSMDSTEAKMVHEALVRRGFSITPEAVDR